SETQIDFAIRVPAAHAAYSIQPNERGRSTGQHAMAGPRWPCGKAFPRSSATKMPFSAGPAVPTPPRTDHLDLEARSGTASRASFRTVSLWVLPAVLVHILAFWL